MHAVQTFHSLFYYEDVRQFSLTFLSKLNYLGTKVRLCRLTGDSISIGCLSRMLLLQKLMNYIVSQFKNSSSDLCSLRTHLNLPTMNKIFKASHTKGVLRA